FFHYRLSPELKSCRRLSCAKIQTPQSNSPTTSRLNATENLLRSLINDAFLFSARHSKTLHTTCPSSGGHSTMDLLYQTHFGLSQAPFNITPDPSFLYLSASH